MCVLYCAQKLLFVGIQIPPMEKDACYADQHIGDGQGNQRNFRICSMLHVRNSIMA